MKSNTFIAIIIFLAVIAIWFGFVLLTTAYAFLENPPPVDAIDMYGWMEKTQQEVNRSNIPFTTTDPNSNRNGQRGDMVYYYTSNGLYLMICASAPTTWRGVQIQNIIGE